jgi:lysophospholipase L1-like esterase
MTHASARDVLLSRPALAGFTLLALATALELTPWLARFRLFGERPAITSEPRPMTPPAAASVGEATLETETEDRGTPAPAAEKKRTVIAGPGVDPALPGKDQPPRGFDDPSGRALARFFAKLARVAAKEPGAVARIAHFGDSTVMGDMVSGTLRRDFQARFGDAGHGFVLIANAWPSYLHWDVARYATAGFKVSRIVGPYAEDGFYGLGGVSFRAGPHALARFGTSKSGPVGGAVSRFVIAYAEEPRGGRFQVRLDGKDLEVIDTRGETLAARYRELSAPDGPHELELQTLTGESRLFGVILERDGPGVVLDALGTQGARVRFLDKQVDAHWAEQLRSRASDLVIYQFGANESGDGFAYSMADFHRTMKEVVVQQQRALPESSCLVIGAMDRAAKQGEAIVSVRVIPALVEEQKRVAEAVGCAFFDTYRAMGGKGSMPLWVKRGLAQADLTHPSGAGAERIGHWLFGAMLRDFAAWQARERDGAPQR